MRVEPSGAQPPIPQPLPQTNPTPRSAAKSGDAGATVPTTVPTATTGSAGNTTAALLSGAQSYSPTGELAQLIQLVHQVPDVRPGVVADVAARLASGELNSPPAVAAAAQAFLDAMRQGS